MSSFQLRGTSLICLLTALLALPSRAAALDPAKAITQFAHSVWQTRDGLPQNTISAIAQTPDGYLWLGTREGLARFDGLRFKIFNTESTPEIGHNQILSLFTDKAGALWIGTWGGGLTRLEAGRFTRFTAADGLPSELVSTIFQDAQGRLWIGTDGGGLARLDGDRFTAMPSRDALGKHVRAIAEDNAGLWIGSDAGLAHLTPGGTLESFGPQQGLAHRSVRTLLRSRGGVLWIGTEHGLNWMEGRTLWGFPDGRPLAHDMVFALREDRDGGLWVGTDAQGLRRLHDGVVTSFTSQHGLSNNSVYSLFEDREQNLWIGTNLGGLNRLRDAPITPFTQREGLSNNYTRAIFQDAEGSVWIGTEGGGINRLREGGLTTFTTKQGLSNDTVFSIAQDPSGVLWIGTDSGLTRFENDRMQSVTRNTPMANESMLALAVSRDGSIWLGTFAAGLVRYHDGAFTAFDTTNGFPHNTVNVIHEARDGTLWIGTRGGGLSRYRDGHFTTFTTRDGLSDNLVFALHEDAAGVLWIGTYGGGLNRLKDGRFTSIRRAQGLYDDVIHRIIDDGGGQFWMSTNRGIFRARQAELDAVADGTAAAITSVAYGPRDGMRNAECNGGGSSGARTRDGRIWFPTIAGAVSFNPQQLGTSAPAPPVVIEEVLVDGRPVEPRPALTMPSSAQTLAIDFTAMSLIAPESLRFRYRLEGLEDDWVEADGRRTAYYSKLPPGRYQFRVIASSRDGVWGDAGATLALAVAPTWYETAWFRGGVVLMLALIGPLLYRARVAHLIAQKASLERIVAERTAELAEANARLVRLADEDGLTGLLNRRAFDAALDEECRRAARANAPLALLLIDIDAFKAYNDHFGHQAGDVCLRAVSDAVRHAHRRAGELVARYGGEELGVILPATSPAVAVEMAENVRRSVENLALPHPASPAAPVVTICVGVASCGADVPCSHEALVAAADRALYRAKQNGRNRVATTD